MIECIGVLVVIIAGLFIKNSCQQSKIEDLEEVNEANEKLDTIQASMKKAELDAQVKEEIEINGIDSKDWKSKI